MTEHEQEEPGGLAVPGPASHESEESLSADERGAAAQPVPPPSEPKAPASPTQQSLWDRIMGKLKGSG
jgi:hypothetical protein